MTAVNRENPDVIISGIHFDLTDAIKDLVRDKVDKLFNHQSHIIRIRVDIACNTNNSKPKAYCAKGYLEIQGPPLIVTSRSKDLSTSIDVMVEKLDRMLRRRSRLRKVKRKDTHDVEIPADLPKVRDD